MKKCLSSNDICTTGENLVMYDLSLHSYEVYKSNSYKSYDLFILLPNKKFITIQVKSTASSEKDKTHRDRYHWRIVRGSGTKQCYEKIDFDILALTVYNSNRVSYIVMEKTKRNQRVYIDEWEICCNNNTIENCLKNIIS